MPPIPPGGFAGFAQMTPASKLALGGGMRPARSGGTRRRKAKASRPRQARAAKRSGGRKMKFGSPAWQKKYKVGKFRK
jgi:hypothetical protein